jgi:hypothetical protein
MVQEIWRELQEYPNFAVSNFGAVMNIQFDLVKHPSVNQQGILMVNMGIKNQQHVRSVATLVASTFLSDIPRPAHFDTPIHLDGNKTNCHVENLAWRPRWFARKYHQQFNPWERANRYGFRCPVRLVETEEEFPTSWEAAIKYGLLDFEILLAVQNQTVVFPINQRFEVIED